MPTTVPSDTVALLTNHAFLWMLVAVVLIVAVCVHSCVQSISAAIEAAIAHRREGDKDDKDNGDLKST
jgi:hypothetical protein